MAAPEDEAPSVLEDEPTKEQFFATFRAEERAIADDLAAVTSASGGESGEDSEKVHTALDALLGRTQTLEAAFTRAAHVLPAYDVQKYRSTLKSLMESIAARREQLAPRRKFSFKRKTAKASSASVSTATADASTGTVATSGYGSAPPPKAAAAPKAVPAGTQAADASSAPVHASAPAPAVSKAERIENLRSFAVARGAGELAGRDVALQDLEGCQVFILDRIGALHCHGLRRCNVVVGAVASSALLYNCSECTLTLAAKQLRLHDSERMAFHLHTLSGPVIEHCKGILFAPYDLSYDGVEEHWAAAALGRPGDVAASEGPWTDIQDFNWHRRQASPNWRLVPQALRRAPLLVRQDAVAAATAEPLPPALEELERYADAWQDAAAVSAGDARPPAASTASPEALGSDDEF